MYGQSFVKKGENIMLLPVALFRVIVYLVHDILRCNTNNTNETLTIHKRFFVPKIKNTKKFSAFVIVIMNFSSKLEEKVISGKFART